MNTRREGNGVCRVLAHNTAAALYESHGYLISAFYPKHETKESPTLVVQAVSCFWDKHYHWIASLLSITQLRGLLYNIPDNCYPGCFPLLSGPYPPEWILTSAQQ